MKFFSLKILLIFFGAVIAGVGAYYGVLMRSGDEFVAAKRDVIEQIPIRGTMIPAENIELGFPDDGTVVAVHAQAGDRVRRDDVLIELSHSAQEAEIRKYEAKIAVEKATLSQLLSGVSRKEVELWEAKVAAAATTRESARQESVDTKIQADNDLIRDYAFARDFGETILLNAESAMHALEGIYDEKNSFRDIFIVTESRERSDAEWQMSLSRTAFANIEAECAKMKTETAYAVIDAALSNNKTNLEVIRATLQKTAELLDDSSVVFGAPEIGGFITTMMVQRSVINATQTGILTREQDIVAQIIANQAAINQATQKIQEAEAAYAAAERELAVKKSVSAESVIAAHQAQIREYESELAIAKEAVEGGIMRAPVDGVVANISVRRGMLVKKQAPLIAITPSTDTQVKAYIASGDAGKVRVGDVVHMAWENMRTDGRVVSVSGDAVLIHFIANDLEYGAFREVEGVIDVVIRRNAMFIPEMFLNEKAGASVVHVKGPDGIKTVFVLPGIEWQGQREILEGVFEGDVLVKLR